MDITDLSYYRYSTALDFIASSMDDTGRFTFAYSPYDKPLKRKCNMTEHLSVATTLYSGANLLKRNHLSSAANKALEVGTNNSFDDGDTSFVMDSYASVTNANAWMSIACYKANKIDEGSKYANAILKCMKEKIVGFIYEGAADKQVIDKFSQTLANYGLLIIALKLYSDKTGEHKYAEAAKTIQLMMFKRKARLNAYAMWSLYFLEKDEKYHHHYAQQVIASINSFNFNSMSCVFASHALRSYLAWLQLKGVSDEIENKCLQLLNRLLELQVDNNKPYKSKLSGSFIKDEKNQEIRLDYATEAANALRQYLCKGDEYQVP